MSSVPAALISARVRSPEGRSEGVLTKSVEGEEQQEGVVAGDGTRTHLVSRDTAVQIRSPGQPGKSSGVPVSVTVVPPVVLPVLSVGEVMGSLLGGL